MARPAADSAGEAIRLAARERAVPLAQSALAIAAFLVPAALAGTRPGLEFLHPLAVTMLGGLVSLVSSRRSCCPRSWASRARAESGGGRRGPRPADATRTSAARPGPPVTELMSPEGSKRMSTAS